MWRRLNREDFAQSNLLLPDRELHRPFYWRVYEDYEILPPSDDGADSPYIQAASPAGGRVPEASKLYEPLTDTPYLFLEFARIPESKDPNSALINWFHKYGLLGLTPDHPQYAEPLPPGYKAVSHIMPSPRYDDRGGPGDFFEFIWGLLFEAHEALNCYEAALSRDEEKLERALFEEDDQEYAQERRESLERRAEISGRDLIALWVDSALGQTIEYVIGNVHAFSYPEITYPQHKLVWDMDSMPPLQVGQLTRSWSARNLLGAMSLQFYWLITSDSDLSRCKHCGRIISYAPPFPESARRKPRKDKEFCNSRCRQNYHYHNRVKPRRQGQDA